MTRRPFCACCGHPRTLQGCGGMFCNCRLKEVERRNLALSTRLGVHFDNSLRLDEPVRT